MDYEWSTDLLNWFTTGQTNAQAVSVVITSTTVSDQAAPLNDVVEVTLASNLPKPGRIFARVKATLAP